MDSFAITKSSPSRPASATPSFLYSATWISPHGQQGLLKKRDDETAAGAEGFGERDPLCTRTVERRLNKLFASELPLGHWNLQQILDWLEYRGLHQHRELFKRAEVDGKVAGIKIR